LSRNQTGRLLLHWQQQVKKSMPAIRVFLRRFAASLPSHRVLSDEHDKVFSSFDCLQCASCCKNSSPVFTRTDVTRIAGYLSLKPAEFELRYLRADDEGDFIPLHKPCPFLLADNHCSVYDVRPKSCRGFPHTDNPDAWLRHGLMAGNAAACPAAFAIVEKFRNSGQSPKPA
jgi:Fe-S-cluster containining protein